MNKARARNLPVVLVAGALIAMMSTLVAYSPTLYRMFCSLTGYAGTVQRVSLDSAEKAKAATTSNEEVTVFFDANVAADLPWEFHPEQVKVTTHIGEPTKVYYNARNTSDETIVARAVYNVTPYETAPFFFKIECFCFTEEKLAPGESARMPLVFYVDEEMLKDDDAGHIREITLSYTFYKQADRSGEKLEAVRNLKTGSEATDARLQQKRSADFDNDAPRR
jgi:cytochrome c oxidase assembly protein subunit 11